MPYALVPYAFGIFTTVKSALQNHLFMQNEPNFRKSQMNVSCYSTMDWEKWTLGERGKNEPKTNPIKANLLNAQMNVNKVLTKEYEKKLNWALYENEPNLSCRSLWRSRNKANFRGKKCRCIII